MKLEEEELGLRATTSCSIIFQVGRYKSTNTDASAGTKARILTQPALPDMQWCHLAEMGQYGVFPKTTKNGNTHPSADRPQWKLLPEGQVGQYKITNTDAAAGTKARILTQPALPGARLVWRFWFGSQWYSHLRRSHSHLGFSNDMYM